jgi:hypothetical protein
MPLTHREGLIMYWCEGDRSEESRTYRAALTSADPKILKLFVQWLEKYYGVEKAQMKIRLHLWPTSDEKAAKDFWSSTLEITPNNFTKSWLKPRGKGTGKRVHPNGICRVSVSSKELLHKIIFDINNEFNSAEPLYQQNF